jgi:hypothetical protein
VDAICDVHSGLSVDKFASELTDCLSVNEFASELTDCLSVDELTSELTDCLSVDEFASELTNCLSVDDEFASQLTIYILIMIVFNEKSPKLILLWIWK